MRVLIISALFACASAAPSGVFAPLVAPAVVAPAVVAPAVVAPVNSGDLQAALIDAKVQTEDLIRSVADKQREAVEQAVVDTKEKVIEVNDQIQEKAVESFWADQEKKWQAFDAVQTAQAQIEGSIASNSDAVAKSLVVPGVAGVVAPYSQYIVAPGIIAPALKAAIPEPKPEESKPEPKPEELKSAEKPEEPKTDSVEVESAVKAAEAPKEPETKYVVGHTPLIASFPLSPIGLAPQPWASVVAPGLKTIVPFGAHVIAPTLIKTVW